MMIMQPIAYRDIYLGVDIGGTKTAAGLVTEAGAVVAQAVCPTPAASGGQAVLTQAIALAKSLLTDNGGGHLIAGIGIGAGGQIDANTGVALFATNVLPDWAGVRIKDGFADAFAAVDPSRIAVDNDVNALAMGELRFGRAKGLATVVFLALGTGVGGALLIDGRLHHGARFSGAEFGHIIINCTPLARMDTGGHRGTLEAYASGPGLLQTYFEITDHVDDAIKGRDVAADAVNDTGGPGALAVSKTGEYLGWGLVSLANALDPDIIVIGGGLASLGDLLLTPARRILREHALSGPADCPVITATLGVDASIIGAASLSMASTRLP